MSETYERLAAPFETTHRDNRGGVDLEYITGEQCVSRLNEVLGPQAWTFEVKEHGVWAEADEIWVLGHLEADIDGAMVVREQFGSQKVKRSRNTGVPLDIGFDMKGATTDALKKCASLIGVGLYLSHKEPREVAERPASVHTLAPVGSRAAADAAKESTRSADAKPDALTCAVCGEALTETRFKDGTIWTPMQLAGFGRRKHDRTLCMTHYREANEARKRAELAEDVAF